MSKETNRVEGFKIDPRLRQFFRNYKMLASRMEQTQQMVQMGSQKLQQMAQVRDAMLKAIPRTKIKELDQEQIA